MATIHQNLSVYNKEELPDASDMKIGIVVAEWNDNITMNLLKGAEEALLDCGVNPENIHKSMVPGSFELIYACNKICKDSYALDAVIAIGSVIQGETKHFDFVCDAVSQGIKDVNINYDIPVIFCVLTDNTMQQSIDRSGGIHGNKGTEAAIAAIKMADFRKNVWNG